MNNQLCKIMWWRQAILRKRGQKAIFRKLEHSCTVDTLHTQNSNTAFRYSLLSQPSSSLSVFLLTEPEAQGAYTRTKAPVMHSFLLPFRTGCLCVPVQSQRLLSLYRQRESSFLATSSSVAGLSEMTIKKNCFQIPRGYNVLCKSSPASSVYWEYCKRWK